MQEQVCFWLCPYARIQGAIYEDNTILPTYDYLRGEPRAQHKIALETENKGDCIDCDLCVAVCPTGIDIRDGQQIGCITCGLCIDACDQVMNKLKRPKGLIRYTSLSNLLSGQDKTWYKIPLIITTVIILILSVSATIYGIKNISELSVSVMHHRQPEFVKLSSGEIRNRYQIKIQNKMDNDTHYQLSIIGLNDKENINEQFFSVKAGQAINRMISLDVSKQTFLKEFNPILFHIKEDGGASVDFKTVFMGPVN